MIEMYGLRWLVTALFMLAGGYSSYCCVRPRWPVLRYCHGWHVIMCVAMMAMAWPWGMTLPIKPQLVIFICATLWFLWLGLSGGCCASDDPQRIRTRLAMGYHALMMLAMGWMLWVMGHAMHGHAHHHEMMASGAGLTTAWLILFGVATLYYLVQGLWRLSRGLYRSLGEPLSQLIMAVGMLMMIGAMG